MCNEIIEFGTGSKGVEGMISNFDGLIEDGYQYFININGVEYEAHFENVGVDAIIYGDYSESNYIAVFKTGGNYFVESDLITEGDFLVKVKKEIPANIVKIPAKFIPSGSGIMEIVTNTSTQAVIEFNKFTILNNSGISSITIDLTSKRTGFLNEASGKFTTGSQTSISFSITGSSIQWKDGVDLTALEKNSNYVFSIVGDESIGYFGNIGKF